ncbi:xylulokinase [Clostridium saccharobutylicum]|uniref:Xylulose kinase n=1 Tax=Clostridium saccharobutylicum DSM 13864 TaxID=1345695 RepID=U5MTY7_CLOSA|nr:xylulokinase [Clostridium saccharobutylicum]AGX44264.1 xylulose kinase XylB [Clostridium saccharobutylicum DSM 13864]AQR91553.1 xylulose kinase [Clostridium saccharobutylicum]AQS01458.1 xylulose kinase [Clostridium saccharobutylicum]AQS11067.1 xylulose kinase [Clostridium saccharobutylicum]AQS15441.1 xylulose kinase [Clostridium saccharobutylicum]
MRYLLGLDIGTSGTKTALFDEDGKTIQTATYGYELFQPQVGWAEQDPEDWWKACVKGIKDVIEKSGVQASDIKGIGLSGQMHGLVLVDKDHNVIRKSIIWCDQRTEKECDYMTKVIGAKRLIKITGNPALTGFTLSKLLWVRNNEPNNFEKIYKVLLPKDYIRFKLTDVFATEVSDASGMQMLDINTRNWSEELLNDLNIDKNILPNVYESVVVSGHVTEAAAKLTKLQVNTPVVGGAGDQAAGAIGNGIVSEGIISTVIGTSGVVFAATDTPRFDEKGRVHTLCHAVPNKWHIMGVTQGAGLSLNWFKRTFCAKEVEESDKTKVNIYDILTKKASKSKPGSNGIIYLPYLMGERTPHIDPNVKGAFLGVSLINNHDDFVRSILEGVSFSLKNCLDIIENMNVNISEIRVSGGGAESDVWRQILADIFQHSLTTVKASEGGALGVAILAGVGAGIYESVEDACNRIVKGKEKVNPNTDLKDLYSKIYETYNSAYPRIKDI